MNWFQEGLYTGLNPRALKGQTPAFHSATERSERRGVALPKRGGSAPWIWHALSHFLFCFYLPAQGDFQAQGVHGGGFGVQGVAAPTSSSGA